MQTNPNSSSQENKGSFVRKQAAFRNWISEDSDRFKPESGRYHLYISFGCPWAHRTAIVRNLKGLQDHIGLSVVHPTWQKTKPGVDEHVGWVFVNDGDQPLSNVNGFGSFTVEGCIPDTVNNCRSIRELYELSNDTAGLYSVPVLWDKKEKVIVNNESSEIIRILNSSFNKFSTNPKLDLHPESLRAKIDEVNDWVYANINNGVYRAGFATSQEAYDTAVNNLFNHLDKAEEILSKSRYLCGNQLTEADIRLFVTLVRFDEAYALHFKCNKKMIRDYPNLLNYTREIYQIPAVKDAVKMDHIKVGYYSSQPILNHYAIVPVGPNYVKTLQEKHNRDRF